MTRRSGRSRRWRRWVAVVGVLIVLGGAAVAVAGAAGVQYRLPTGDLFADGGSFGDDPSPSPSPSPSPEPGADIVGPLDILLVGIDPRKSKPEWQPHADAILILHVSKSLQRGYLFSLPRDLILEIPAYEPSGYGGGTGRVLSAMTYGSRVAGTDIPDVEQGFGLLAETVRRYTGIKRFDAGAVLNFGGFTDLVDAIGGVEIRLDLEVASLHREPDGTHRQLQPGGGGYVGPQRVYEPGRHQLEGWEALDIARQRYLPGADYTRQLHQQRLIRGLAAEIVDQQLMTDPVRLHRVLDAVGDALVFDGRDHKIIDYAFALRDLDPGSIELVGLPGGGVFSGGAYQGEALQPVSEDFFQSVRNDRVGRFLKNHPDLARD